MFYGKLLLYAGLFGLRLCLCLFKIEFLQANAKRLFYFGHKKTARLLKRFFLLFFYPQIYNRFRTHCSSADLSHTPIYVEEYRQDKHHSINLFRFSLCACNQGKRKNKPAPFNHLQKCNDHCFFFKLFRQFGTCIQIHICHITQHTDR